MFSRTLRPFSPPFEMENSMLYWRTLFRRLEGWNGARFLLLLKRIRREFMHSHSFAPHVSFRSISKLLPSSKNVETTLTHEKTHLIQYCWFNSSATLRSNSTLENCSLNLVPPVSQILPSRGYHFVARNLIHEILLQNDAEFLRHWSPPTLLNRL